MLAHLVALLAPPACLACWTPVDAGRPLCAGCRADLAWLPRPAGPAVPAWAPVAFDGPARALVHALKFGGRTAAAGVMAAQIAANAPPGLLDGVLVPAPADPLGSRLRGFDHARLIARALGARTGLAVRDLLVRRRAGGPQVGAGRTERLGRDLGIAARGRAPGRVVVVDDVQTTGATLAACARALRAAGALEVSAVTYARTLG